MLAGSNTRNLAFYLQQLGFIIVILFLVVYSVFPLAWGIVSSFKSDEEELSIPITYIPKEPTFGNYAAAFTNNEFHQSLLNSAIVAGTATLLSLVIGGIAAYAMGRYRFGGRSAMRYIILGMNLFPTIAILPSLINIVSGFGLTGTLWSLIFTYPIFTLPSITWQLIVFFQRLPYEIEQAAYVDGASSVVLFYRILIPISLPVLFTTGITTFVGVWSEYLLAVSFVSVPKEARVMTVAIANLASTISAGELMAMSVILSIPLLLVIYFTQREAIKETTEGAVK